LITTARTGCDPMAMVAADLMHFDVLGWLLGGLSSPR
jgi:hypothetical protein